jgi:SAM-dependent methyltransferase
MSIPNQETPMLPVQSSSLPEKIEILSVDLLDQNRALVEELKRLAESLHLEFGWHYLLDLSWAISSLGKIQDREIMDAGAGTGIMQWYLAQSGAKVYSVDRMSRANLPLRFRKPFNVSGLRPEDLNSTSTALVEHLHRTLPGPFFRQWPRRILAILRDLFSQGSANGFSGSVMIYNQDLNNLVDLPDNSIDFTVAISSLEHNTKEGLEQVIAETMRVIKPGGALIATLTAVKEQDWWHEASSGWCYSDASLRRLFHLPDSVPSNYSQYDQLFEKLKNCAELRDNLAKFYSQSVEKGMPRGIWNPEYQPVGVIKVKRVFEQ